MSVFKDVLAIKSHCFCTILQAHIHLSTYGSGVYTVSKGAKPLGGHAVKMIGFGHDEPSGLDYWLVMNSWGTGWGDQGTSGITIVIVSNSI